MILFTRATHLVGDYLTFLELGNTTGVTRTYIESVLDGSSSVITIPGGFPFGNTNQTSVYVSLVGIILVDSGLLLPR